MPAIISSISMENGSGGYGDDEVLFKKIEWLLIETTMEKYTYMTQFNIHLANINQLIGHTNTYRTFIYLIFFY